MCGICGFTGAPDRLALERMAGLLEHRGPDDQGYLEDAAASMGFRRLAIIDLKTGHQPMADREGKRWVVFNGEIFNFKELRAELEGAGYRFETDSDTEVLLHGHEEWGQALPTKLIGMFAYAIFEPGARRLTLCRDRLGIKPLYIARHEGRLLFASEPKAILSFHEFPRAPDREAIEAFLTYLYVPGPSTIFEGISHLPPGHQLVWTPEGTEVAKYWEIAPCGAYLEDEAAVLKQLRALVRDAVRSRLISDVPLGVFLSGGLDSTVLVNEMAKEMPPGQIKTFTIGFEGHAGTFNELGDARAVAEHYGTDHTEYVAGAQVVDILPQLCWHFDAPFANSSAVPMFLLSELAKKRITVALTGVGGDELFAGYPRDLAAALAQDYRKIPEPLRAAAGRLAARLPESTTGRAGTRRIKQIATGTLADPEDEYVAWVSCFSPAERRELLPAPVAGAAAAGRPEEIYRRHLASGFPDMLTRVLLADLKLWLPYNLLEYSDKMSMAHAVENRVPLLDHRLVEFAFRVHPRLKVKGLRGKFALRRAFAGELPRRVLAKKKAGFVAPLGYMYQTELKGLVGQVLSPERIREHGLFREDKVRKVVAEHNAGTRDRSNQLTGLLLLDIWHELYFGCSDLARPAKGLGALY